MTAPLRLVAPPASDVPPHDVDAEAAVLSSVLIDPAALGKVRDFLRPEHFYAEAHRRIYEAALDVAGAGTPLDLVTVGRRLKETGRIAHLPDGTTYLITVSDAAPAVVNVAAYGEAVYDLWRRRRAIDMGRRITAEGYLADDLQPWLERKASELGELARASVASVTETHLDGLRRFGEACAGRKVRRAGISTGIPSWDALTDGLQPGSKVTVIGPTGSGKSHLVTHVSVAAARAGVPVILFSLGEMTADEMLWRRLANLARVDSKAIRAATSGRNEISPEGWSRIHQASSDSARWPIYVVDERLTVEDIAARSRRLVEQVGHALVIVDYVQKVTASPHLRTRDRHEQVAHATRGLKSLAQELAVPVLEMSQQRRGEDKNPRAKPVLEKAAAESKVVEVEADQIVCLYRYDLGRKEDVTGIVLKQRGGEDGREFMMRMELAYSRIGDGP